jgi:hypothetical protein
MAEEQVQEFEQAPPVPPKKQGFFKLFIIVLIALGVGGGAAITFTAEPP